MGTKTIRPNFRFLAHGVSLFNFVPVSPMASEQNTSINNDVHVRMTEPVCLMSQPGVFGSHKLERGTNREKEEKEGKQLWYGRSEVL